MGYFVDLFNSNWEHVYIAKFILQTSNYVERLHGYRYRAWSRVVQHSCSHHQHLMIVLIYNTQNNFVCHWVVKDQFENSYKKILNPCYLKNAYFQHLQNAKSLESSTYLDSSKFFQPDCSHHVDVNKSRQSPALHLLYFQTSIVKYHW